MRIAYLTEWPPYVESGVLRKMIGQISAWREAGHTAEIFTVAPLQDRPTAAGFADYGRVVGSFTQDQLERFPRARLGFVNKIASAPKLRRALAAFKPDVIYYRQAGPWYPGLGGILRRYPSVAEINTYEAAENALWGSGFNRFQQATRRRVLSAVDGLVCVTQEIADHEAWTGKPAAVIGNPLAGDPIDVPRTTHTHAHYVFTGSPMTLDAASNWHGVDKLVHLAQTDARSHLHIAGMEAKDFPALAERYNVTFHGMLDAAALSALYAQCDVGLGTLALHRKSMEEACPLKVRDYLMHRLPVVIGYREAQPELNDAPYMLQIGNHERNVLDSLIPIIAFARKWAGKRVKADLGFLTSKTIEARRLEFLAQIASASR